MGRIKEFLKTISNFDSLFLKIAGLDIGLVLFSYLCLLLWQSSVMKIISRAEQSLQQFETMANYITADIPTGELMTGTEAAGWMLFASILLVIFMIAVFAFFYGLQWYLLKKKKYSWKIFQKQFGLQFLWGALWMVIWMVFFAAVSPLTTSQSDPLRALLTIVMIVIAIIMAHTTNVLYYIFAGKPEVIRSIKKAVKRSFQKVFLIPYLLLIGLFATIILTSFIFLLFPEVIQQIISIAIILSFSAMSKIYLAKVFRRKI